MKVKLIFRTLLLVALLLTVVEPAFAQNVPAILPAENSFGIRIVDGRLDVVKTVSNTQNDLWQDPLCIYLFEKETRKEIELTRDQEAELAKIDNTKREFEKGIGEQSLEFSKQSRDENGKFDVAKYKELIKQNFDATKEFNIGVERKLRECILPHQWKKLANIITLRTLRTEGVANHITEDRFADYLGLTEKQRQDLESRAEDLVKENDAALKKLATESMRRLLEVLTPVQQEKLMAAMDIEQMSELETVHVVVLNEQLRRFLAKK